LSQSCKQVFHRRGASGVICAATVTRLNMAMSSAVMPGCGAPASRSRVVTGSTIGNQALRVCAGAWTSGSRSFRPAFT
jgi:hypothetical protein